MNHDNYEKMVFLFPEFEKTWNETEESTKKSTLAFLRYSAFEMQMKILNELIDKK